MSDEIPDEVSTEEEFEIFQPREVAATLDAPPDEAAVEQINAAAKGCEITVLQGDAGREAFEPEGLFNRFKAIMDERNQPFSVLSDHIEQGGVVVRVNFDGESAGPIAKVLVDLGAGWVYEFDDLIWTELSSPNSPT